MIRWPLVSNVIRRGSSSNTFGPVRRDADGSPRNHQGWDFFAPIGTPCFAIADGRIEFAGDGGVQGYGLLVVHSFEWNSGTLFAAFAHLNRIDVTQGAVVSKGQQLGLTGDSGNARGMTGADLQLHFEIRTIVRPGKGLAGRISPLEIFEQLPMKTPIIDPV
ncbi:M23 family metallopeptidase [Sandarakinorhabdus sp. AAP62]|uniref:M23 family metallopeptidase n=1 Tax=Sandarakinorhabdus sp. AAP62 TaxID=1248916 RepID=UPI0003104584|nr:M23 family metallopeptidase [Sandarakinorhabdus sp. AAP62]